MAVYYTLADIVLLAQCFYYRGFTLSDDPSKSTTAPEEDPTEEAPLLERSPDDDPRPEPDRTRSTSSFRKLLNVDGAHHLSPATPLLDGPKPSDPPATRYLQPTSTLQTIIFNSFAIIMVCVAGVFGWWVSSQGGRQAHQRGGQTEEEREDTLDFSLWGQIFGYLCAVLYLGSRIPQILLNYRRKSTEGVSLLFFLFACIGNLTYVLSIFAYSPICASRHCRPGEAGAIYGRYILVNASWIVGSFGTLLLDLGIFAQFFIYRKQGEEDTANNEAETNPRLETGEGRGRSPNER